MNSKALLLAGSLALAGAEGCEENNLSNCKDYADSYRLDPDGEGFFRLSGCKTVKNSNAKTHCEDMLKKIKTAAMSACMTVGQEMPMTCTATKDADGNLNFDCNPATERSSGDALNKAADAKADFYVVDVLQGSQVTATRKPDSADGGGYKPDDFQGGTIDISAGNTDGRKQEAKPLMRHPTIGITGERPTRGNNMDNVDEGGDGSWTE